MDVRRLRAGQPYSIDRLLDGRVRRFEYEIDADKRLTGRARRRSTARRDSSPPSSASRNRRPSSPSKATSIAKPIRCRPRSTRPASASSSRSAWRMCSRARSISIPICSPAIKFRVLVERHTREGKLSGYGAILAAEFVNDNRKLQGDSVHARRRLAGVLRRERPLAEALLPEVAAEVRAAHHVALLELAQASDPRLRARAQRRRLLRAGRRAGRIGGAGRGDAGRLDQRRRPHRQGAASERLRDRIPAPVGDRRPRRRAHRPGRAGRPRRQDRPRHRRPSALRLEEERPLREPRHRAPQHAARRAGCRRR